MTTAEMNTLGDLVTAMTQAEVALTQAQQKVGEAMDVRDSRRKAYLDFLASIPVSDAPAELKPKRKYERKMAPKPPLGSLVKLLDTNVNAAQTSLSGLPDENAVGR